MSFNAEQHKEELIFLPLGGAGEIGMNLNLYHYKGKILIVDFGVGFADTYLPGVDMIVPDITYLIKNKDKVIGMILTHIHEDHLGAVQYIWDEVRCPIYTTKFTASFLRAKVAGSAIEKMINIKEVEDKSTIDLTPFTIDLVPLTHSTPEMSALIIRTDLGSVLHTGDWKFDHDPLIGEANDEDLLKSYGEKGILAMIGDSTNVFNSGFSGSEGDLRHSLIDIIKQRKKMVVVTTFASNVARIETIIKAAEASGRRVVLAGRSLWRIVAAAQDAGYLTDIEDFLTEKEIAKYPRDKILVIATGCQGEPLAAATKIASNTHPFIRISKGDTIIFSSKIIPGNDKKIFRLFNFFVKLGVEVLTEKDHFVHVSGHPSRDELKKMYELIKPKISIPVHGELVHMYEHAKLASEIGVPNVLQIENGDVIKLAPGDPQKINKVEVGYLGIDGNYLLSPKSPVLRVRRKIQNDGVIVVTLLMSHRASLVMDPIIDAPGSLDKKEDKELLEMMIEEIRDIIEDSVGNGNSKNSKKLGDEHLVNLVRTTIRRIMKREVGKMPVIEVNILDILPMIKIRGFCDQ